MSTRCNVRIKDKQGDELLFYRHSDGYPEGALPTLKTFMQWVADGKIRSNVEQASGWLILIGAKEYDTRYERQPDGSYKDVKKENLLEPDLHDHGYEWKCGAYEPSVCIHGDIEFLYTLDLHELTITIYNEREHRVDDIIYFDKSEQYIPF
jgi:hypothetical protein